MTRELLWVEHAASRHAGQTAVNDLSLQVYEGEILFLTGLIDAGLYTAADMLTGRAQGGGMVWWNGQKASLFPEAQARRLGIYSVGPQSALIQQVSVADNLQVMDSQSVIQNGRFFVHSRQVNREAVRLLGQYGVSIEPQRRVDTLPLAEQHILEIIKYASYGARLIILREATLHYTTLQLKRLLALLRSLRERGLSILLISTHLEPLSAFADRCMVLRQGRVAGTLRKQDYDPAHLAALVTGNVAFRAPTARRTRPELENAPQVLRIEGLPAAVTVHYGETVGVWDPDDKHLAGIEQALTGIEQTSLHIWLEGAPFAPRDIRSAVHQGLAYIPLGSQVSTIFPNLGEADNLAFMALRRTARFGMFVNPRVLHYLEDGEAAEAPGSSGGAEGALFWQKISFRRWRYHAPRLCLLVKPCLYADEAMRTQLFREIERLAQIPAGVLILSTDRSELAPVCQRVISLAE